MVYKHLGVITENGYRVLLDNTKLDTLDIDYYKQPFILSMILENEYAHHASSKYKNFYNVAITFQPIVEKEIYKFIVDHEDELRVIDQSDNEVHAWCFIFTENMQVCQVSETPVDIEYLICEAKRCLKVGYSESHFDKAYMGLNFFPSRELDNYVYPKTFPKKKDNDSQTTTILKDGEAYTLEKSNKSLNDGPYYTTSSVISKEEYDKDKEELKLYFSNKIDDTENIIKSLLRDEIRELSDNTHDKYKEFKNFKNIIYTVLAIFFVIIFLLGAAVRHTNLKINQLHPDSSSSDVFIEEESNENSQSDHERISQLEEENEQLYIDYLVAATGANISNSCEKCPSCGEYPTIYKNITENAIRVHCSNCGLSGRYYTIDIDHIDMAVREWNDLTRLIQAGIEAYETGNRVMVCIER